MTWRPHSLASLTALLLLAKRDVVLGGVLLLAVLFLANGAYILIRGRIGPPLTKLPQPGKVLLCPSRLALAALYFAVGTALVVLVWHLGMA
jgi:membrane protein implicated in regulation of membrane protease activity